MPTILLVEDNDMNAEMLSRRLTQRGFTVVLAADGLAAVAQSAATAPDLILMDKSLPEIDGWEATRRIRTAGAARHVPIIALTAHALPAERVQAIEAGCDDFETKPIAFDRLLDKIAVLLDRYPR